MYFFTQIQIHLTDINKDDITNHIKQIQTVDVITYNKREQNVAKYDNYQGLYKENRNLDSENMMPLSV